MLADCASVISSRRRLLSAYEFTKDSCKSCADMSMPSFVEFLKGAVVKAGASARLQCTVECQPTPAKITWCVSVSLYIRPSATF